MSIEAIEKWLSHKVIVTFDNGQERSGFLHRQKEGVYGLGDRRVFGPSITVDVGPNEALLAEHISDIRPDPSPTP